MSDGLFPDLRAHHVGISVSDLDRSIAFWKKLFGFELDFKTEIPPSRPASLSSDAVISVWNFSKSRGSSPVPEDRLAPNTDLRVQGTKHLCFSVEDVQKAAEKLHANGVKLVGIMRGHGSPMALEEDPRLDAEGHKKPAMAIFFHAPDGVLVEVLRRGDFKD